MRISLTSGITADSNAEFRVSLPVNLEIVPVDNKIAKAQFRAPSGAVQVATGPGVDRGGIVWNDQLYRVMGTSLVRVNPDNSITTIGDVGGTGPCTFDMGFDRMAVRSGNSLYYLTGSGLVQMTDPDQGVVKDLLWIDGYYMTTDGTSIVVTELANPLEVKPLKYGSAEEDPDMVTGLIKLRDEAYVLGRYTIQVLRNVGSNGFPFANVRGASIPVGCVSASAKCLYADTFAFVGSARDEALGVYLAGGGSATRISDRHIDDALAAVSDPTSIVLENRTSRGERRLLVHLPTKTLVFLANATKDLGEPVWYIAHSGVKQPYRPRLAIPCYGKTYVGDVSSAALGVLSDDVSTHFGQTVEWQFDAGLVYNDAKGFILHALELIGLPGRAPIDDDPVAFMSMTKDGQTYSVERAAPLGRAGQRLTRMIWRPCTNFRNMMGLRFRGLNQAMPGFAALEATMTPLSV